MNRSSSIAWEYQGGRTTRSRSLGRSSPEEDCTAAELRGFQRLAGQLNYLGHGELPSASFVASHLQQFAGSLKVKHLSIANASLHELRKLDPTLCYSTLPDADPPSYLAFSDASQGNRIYGQTGYLSGIHFSCHGTHSVYHVLDCYSGKQVRVSFSSIGAEILAAAESADRGSLMASCIQDVFKADSQLPLVLTFDSLGLYSTITSLLEGRDYRLRPVVARLRDSFENKDISGMQRIQGKSNLADVLTKRNVVLYKTLNDTCSSGLLDA